MAEYIYFHEELPRNEKTCPRSDNINYLTEVTCIASEVINYFVPGNSHDKDSASIIKRSARSPAKDLPLHGYIPKRCLAICIQSLIADIPETHRYCRKIKVHAFGPVVMVSLFELRAKVIAVLILQDVVGA